MGHLEVGVAGESAALSHYLSLGFEEVLRNWRCKVGELDLVVRRDDLLVFCEVKTRSPGGFSDGFDAVTPAKIAKLRRLAELFLFDSNLRPSAVRFDVASVELREQPVVTLFEDAF
ncbi:MAG: YraN family protein [Actinobacteria bacterium]|nr:YraN family protein [Actinomycetota bacterium]